MTHSPLMVLAAVGEKDQLSPVMALACALANAQNGTVTLLCVTPDGKKPGWLRVPKECGDLPVQTVVHAGSDVARVILEVSRTLHPDLLLMGWRGSPGQRRYLLGSTLDPVTRYAPCDVAVIRVDELGQIRRALVPMSSGPNAPLALELALQLADDVQVTALNVVRESLGPTAEAAGYEQLRTILEPWKDDERISTKVVRASGVIEGILQEAGSDYDLLLIGASNESYIDRQLFGNVPQTVATEAAVPTVVVRRRAGPVRIFMRAASERLAHVQNTLTVAEQVETYREVRRGARAHPEFFVLIALASAIATLGLLMDSPAVIIGAMVIAPLMSSILGISLGMVQGDPRLLWIAASTTLRGTGLAILIGIIIGAVVPGKELNSEILSRAQPTLFDLGVAIFSGLVGAYAQCRRSVLSAVSGVAIAVALIPPLATIGIGTVMLQSRVATGALLLFSTNLIAIVATGAMVFLFFGFRPDPGKRFRVFGGSMLGVVALLLAVSIILTILTVGSVQSTLFRRQIDQVLASEIGSMPGVTLVSWERTGEDTTVVHLLVRVQATRGVSPQEAADLERRLASDLRQQVDLRLVITPVTELDVPAPSS